MHKLSSTQSISQASHRKILIAALSSFFLLCLSSPLSHGQNFTFDHKLRKQVLLNADGTINETINVEEYRKVNDTCALVKEDGAWGLLNAESRYIIQPKYELLSRAYDKKLIAKKEGKYGIIDHSEDVLIDFIFEDIDHYTADEALFKQNGKWYKQVGDEVITDPSQFNFFILDQKPRLSSCIKKRGEYDEACLLTTFYREVQYPAEARNLGIEGRVVLELQITSEGQVSNSEIRSGIGAGCDEEALRVCRKVLTKWSPALRDGMPVSSTFLFPANFRLE